MLLQLGKTCTELENFLLQTDDRFLADLDLQLGAFGCLTAQENFFGEHVELPPGPLRLQILQLGLEGLESAGLAGLTLQRTDLTLHLANEVLDAQEVLFGAFELAQGLALLLLEAGDARGLFEHEATVIRLARQDLGDVALGHDRVTRLAHARAGEELLDVAQAAGSLVEEVLAAPVAVHAPSQGHLIEFHRNTRRAQRFGIHATERERHLGQSQRPPRIGAVEDHVGHFPAAQRLGRLLTQHPSDGIRHVGLATAIGSDNRRHSRLEVQAGLVGKALEPENGQVFEVHRRADWKSQPPAGKPEATIPRGKLFTTPQDKGVYCE